MLYCPNFFWNVLQVWMTGKDVYLQMTWSWPDKTWNILCSYCLQWNTSQSKFRNHYFLFLFAFSILSQLFLIWGCIYIYIYLFTSNADFRFYGLLGSNCLMTNTNCLSIFIMLFFFCCFFFHSQYYKDLQACRHERDILSHSFLEGRVCNSCLLSNESSN